MINMKAVLRKWWLPLPLLPLIYGMLGFRLIEGWSWAKCYYYTVLTITTVGYDDGGMSGAGKMFSTTVMITGIGVFFFVISYTLQNLIEHSNFQERRQRRKVNKMRNHYIICGAGRVGQEMGLRLKERKTPFVLLESDLNAIEVLKSLDLPYIPGDATTEETLEVAGVAHARGLACVLNSDADNVFTTLTARGMNPGLFIVARANNASASSKLLKAGANKALNPFTSTASRMMNTLLKPTVTDFLEIAHSSDVLDLAIEEVLIPEGSVLDGCRIAESELRQKENVIAAAIQKKGGRMVFNPIPTELIEAGDVLIALGSQEALEALANRVSKMK